MAPAAAALIHRSRPLPHFLEFCLVESYKVVRPVHLNHYGYLFGGELLKWVDEISWVAASREFPGCKFVTVGMDRVEFRRSVHQGTLLRFLVARGRRGQTSVEYEVTVYADDLETGAEDPVFATRVTFVCLDAAGVKARLPEPLAPS
jgi:acyl-CoA hydrolase